MKRLIALLTLGVFLHSLTLSAADTPHLDLVRGLRAQQMADYALLYLQRLAEKPPPELALLLPLEMAKTRIDLAQLEPNENRKAALQAQARGELTAFLEKNPKHPLAAEANLDIARLAALQGKNQLSKARRQETTAGERAELVKARAQFVEAGKQLKAAAERIDDSLAAYAEPKMPEEQNAKRMLTRARIQAELEQAINLLDQAQSYHLDDPSAEKKNRGAIVKQAMTMLEKLSRQDDKNPLSWEARVWLGRAHQENDDPGSARKVYGEVIAEDGEHARGANRLARYFRMLVMQDDKNEKDPLTKVRASAEQWLDRYPSFVNTSEGFGVRFELASVYYQQALRLPKAQQAGPKGKELFTRAQRQFQVLEQSKNDFSEQARRKRLEIILFTSQEVSKGTVDKLKNFDECFLRAQVEIAKMNELAKKDLPKEKQEEQRTQHFATMIEALNRGLELADPKVAVEDKSDARYLLTYAYLANGDPYRAAVVGEELARSDPKSARAPLAGAYALFAYSQIISEERQTAGADVEGHRNRVRRLAVYIEKTWPDDPASDGARFQLGMLLLQGKKHAEAVEVLERVSPNYNEAIRAMYQLAMAAFQAHREGLKSSAKLSYEDRGIRALRNVPELPPGADAGMQEVYYLARLELSRVHYADKKFTEMQALLDKLAKQLADAKDLDEKAKESIAETVKARKLLALYGVSEELYAKGEYEKVRKELDPILKEFDDPEKVAAATTGNDPRFVYALMGLAVRANIQDNQLERGKEILASIQKGNPENSRQVLVQLVFQLERQIQALRGEEGAEAKKRLEQTMTSFTAFLGELGKQPKLDAETSFFLAQSYSSLDKPKEAAELLSKITEPAPLKLGPEPQPPEMPANPDDKVAQEAYQKKLKAHEKEIAEYKQQADGARRSIQIYRASRILRVRSLRLGKDYKTATAEAEAVLKQKWAADNMDLQKERIYILEDQGFYGGKTGAVRAWYDLMDRMKNAIENLSVKELYFECYYNFARCMYLAAQKLPDAKRKDEDTRRAAQAIVNLRGAINDRRQRDAKESRMTPDLDKLEEAAWKRFEGLLQKEAPLKKAYDELAKKA